jgi:hypothetical protein
MSSAFIVLNVPTLSDGETLEHRFNVPINFTINKNAPGSQCWFVIKESEIEKWPDAIGVFRTIDEVNQYCYENGWPVPSQVGDL